MNDIGGERGLNYSLEDPKFDPIQVLVDYIDWDHRKSVNFYSLDFKIWFDMRAEYSQIKNFAIAQWILLKWEEIGLISTDCETISLKELKEHWCNVNVIKLNEVKYDKIGFQLERVFNVSVS